MRSRNASADLRNALRRVRWIGWGSGAGKTKLAKLLAHAQGAQLYASDDTMPDHAMRCPADQCPRLEDFKRMNMDDRWVNRTPKEMLDSFHWFAGERFDLIVEDLLALPRTKPVLAEGFRLMPRLVAPLVSDPHHGVWLLPTPAFRKQAFAERGTTWDTSNRTSNPDRALANLLARDALFTDRVAAECHQLGLSFAAVDVSSPQSDGVEHINARFFG